MSSKIDAVSMKLQQQIRQKQTVKMLGKVTKDLEIHMKSMDLEKISQTMDKFEEQLQKPVWKREKMDEGALHRMLRMIVPCRMEIEDVQGTWKLNQNKDDDVRFRAADAIERDGIGESLSELAKLMRY